MGDKLVKEEADINDKQNVQSLWQPNAANMLQCINQNVRKLKLTELHWSSQAQTVVQDFQLGLANFKSGLKRCQYRYMTATGLAFATGAAVIASTVATGGLSLLAAGAAGLLGVSSMMTSKTAMRWSVNLMKHSLTLAIHNTEEFLKASKRLSEAMQSVCFVTVIDSPKIQDENVAKMFQKSLQKLKECENISWYNVNPNLQNFAKIIQEKINYLKTLQKNITTVCSKMLQIHKDILNAENLMTKTFVEYIKQHQPDDMDVVAGCISTNTQYPEEMQYEIVEELLGRVSSLQAEIQRIQSQDRACVICMDQNMDVVFLPCRHMNSCQECSQQVNECPICRRKISEKLKIYPQ